MFELIGVCVYTVCVYTVYVCVRMTIGHLFILSPVYCTDLGDGTLCDVRAGCDALCVPSGDGQSEDYI